MSSNGFKPLPPDRVSPWQRTYAMTPWCSFDDLVGVDDDEGGMQRQLSIVTKGRYGENHRYSFWFLSCYWGFASPLWTFEPCIYVSEAYSLNSIKRYHKSRSCDIGDSETLRPGGCQGQHRPGKMVNLWDPVAEVGHLYHKTKYLESSRNNLEY